MSDLEIDTELALTNLQELEHKYFRSAEGGLANLSIRVIKALQEQLTTLQAEKERLEGVLGRLPIRTLLHGAITGLVPEKGSGGADGLMISERNWQFTTGYHGYIGEKRVSVVYEHKGGYINEAQSVKAMEKSWQRMMAEVFGEHPTQEPTTHLSPDEQRAMKSALRKTGKEPTNG